MTESYRLVHLPSGKVVATVQRADGFWAKGWGVLGWRDLLPGQGLWLPDVASVHTAFVRFPLDLLFLDREFRAVKFAPRTPPWRWLVRAPGACHVLELGAGTLTGGGTGTRAGEGWRLERTPVSGC